MFLKQREKVVLRDILLSTLLECMTSGHFYYLRGGFNMLPSTSNEYCFL